MQISFAVRRALLAPSLLVGTGAMAQTVERTAFTAKEYTAFGDSRLGPLVGIPTRGLDPAAYAGIVNALRLRDGRLVAIVRGPANVALFDEAGTFVRLLGRNGKAAGEFEQPYGLQPLEGDTIVVFDATRTLTYLLSGASLGTTPLARAVDRNFTPMRLSSGNELIGRQTQAFTLRATPGQYADTVAIVGMSLRGDILRRTFARFAGTDAIHATVQGVSPSSSVTAVPFAASLYTAVSAEQIFVIDARRPELLRIPIRQGDRAHVFVFPMRSRRVEASEVALARQRIASRGDTPEAQELNIQIARRVMPPKTYPYFDRIRVTTDGGVLAREYVTGLDSVAWWLWLDGAGRLMARFRTDPMLQVIDASGREVMGIARDGRGTETLVRSQILPRR